MIQATDSIPNKREHELNSLYTVGLICTLAFVTMTFAALLVVFIIRSRVSINWDHIILPWVLWLDTVVLAASSYTFETGHKKLRANDQGGFYQWTLYTAALGVVFLAGQLIAWWQIISAGQLVRSNPHSSFFFILSGLHGIHILVALAGLGALLYRTHEPASGPRWQMTTRVMANAVGIFWHYLDGLWIVLLILLLAVGR